ncbi:MAG: hypothetical protein NWS46_11010 [Cyclobacteriaceae bacterium]|nr:hypothetical protein [Cyclobacteriaceae bacterium]
MKIGLVWTLSSLGAELPKGSLDLAIHDFGQNTFNIDLSQVGFTVPCAESFAGYNNHS